MEICQLSNEEKKAINDLNFIIVTDIYDNEVSIDKTKIINEYNESVGIVLNLIEKQSKEIEELSIKLTDKICRGVEEEILEEYRQEIKELKSALLDSTPNDKIKAIIEERNKWIKEYDEQEEMNELQKDDYRLIKVERNILQSLLEEKE